MGETGLAQYVESMYDRTRQFAQIIQDRPGFYLPFSPESNILCFQYKHEHYDQLQLREKLIRTGKFYITTTEIRGTRFLRLVLMNEQTSADTIKGMLDEIELIAETL
jgi:L-2,4-diaminobutyrate decarboxylase